MKRVLFEFSVKELGSELSPYIAETVRRELQKQTEVKIPSQDRKYGTRKEVAKSLHISLPTLHELTKSGVLTGYRMQGRVLYKWAEVDEALVRMETLKHKQA